MRSLIVILAVSLGIAVAIAANAGRQMREAGRDPVNAWTCPASHAIKGNFTTYSGEPCIYHVPGGRFYDKTKPERCYATEQEATEAGCRRSSR